MWNPPALTAIGEGQDLDSVTIMLGGADDRGHFKFPPIGSVGINDVRQHDAEGDCISYLPEFKSENKRLCLDLNRLADPKTNTNFNDVKFLDDMSEFNGVFQTPYPEVTMSELHNSTDESATVPDDCSVSYRKLEAQHFIPQSCDMVIRYPIKAHGMEAKNRRISRIPLNSSISSELDTSSLQAYTNFAQQSVDRDFLSLEIGGGMEIKSDSKFDAREVASKLEDPRYSQYIGPTVGQIPESSLSLTPHVGFQTNVGGLSCSSLADTCDEGDFYGNTCSKRNQLLGFQAPQANPRPSFQATHDNFGFNMNSSLSPSGIPIVSECGLVSESPLGTQMPRPTSFASQVIPLQQLDHRRSSVNGSSESSRHRGSSKGHVQLGSLTPLVEAKRHRNIAGVCFPGGVQTVGNLSLQADGTSAEVANTFPSQSIVQPVGQAPSSHNVSCIAGISSIPQRFTYPIPRVSPIQSAADSGKYPRRLGVQPSETTARTIEGQQVHALPAQVPIVPPSPYYSSGRATPPARYGVRPHGFVSRPHLKRQAAANPPNERLVQHRRIIPNQPAVIYQSAAGKRPSFPHQAPIKAMGHFSPEDPLHIKWAGFDEMLEPSGHKCFLCKRDVSFTSEGRVNQPPIPPASAVLPCGHTFHDDCLQRITPGDCLRNPPCIPCALGET